MSTTDTGKRAEAAVATFLKGQGYTIVEQNWRTRWCEIDIVARKGEVVYFVEVKYRKSDSQGDGLEYITSQKLNQMTFAAELWVSNHRWEGEYALAAAAVNGENYNVTDLIEL
jgi:uncharacterized protein (TIGR00252 family)